MILKILLVDDDEDNRIHLSNLLKGLGHQVVSCSDARQALDLIVNSSFNLLLSETSLPGSSGLELIRHIRKTELAPGMEIILFSADNDQNTVIEALRIGVCDYLVKPIDEAELLAVIARIARRHASALQDYVTPSSGRTMQTSTESGQQQLNKPEVHPEESLSQTRIFSSILKRVFVEAACLHREPFIPVLIQGETGTGKELVARYIHFGEQGTARPFVALNCAALAPTMFESELFGYEAGTFTGGLTPGKKGKLDLADGGSILLDEITEIPVELQSKLLRVIQEREYYRVGGLKPVGAKVRFICTTNRNIEKMVREGRFRRDLYYRLNVGNIYIPPLRERREEILPLAEAFLLELSREKGKSFFSISPRAAEVLLNYDWPGNIRQLRNEIERAVLFQEGPRLEAHHLTIGRTKVTNDYEKYDLIKEISLEAPLRLPPENFSLEELVNRIILEALQMHKSNKTRTAKYLGISRSSLLYRLKKIK